MMRFGFKKYDDFVPSKQEHREASQTSLKGLIGGKWLAEKIQGNLHFVVIFRRIGHIVYCQRLSCGAFVQAKGQFGERSG